ncbi:uncharacterized protein ANIA_06622 [Aspergillus nidulans FGSC A4]|uniref:Rhodopsin domain-containing protein n=1 Tax=Emericella nidulans (strain FGSC A4 / ATCC 38163 / CBS 112.46 / NRRL 194 / M139) TaxID=227321 RepID=C8V160_EMENI|nr:hypothetical protein [Aspergillus nidulans FGSC A4]CBF71117.1 TPA: conserved hypothetical protein [Aspergillus nidulans FGSC A4]
MHEDLSTTLALVGVFGGLSIILMAIRLFMRKYRNQDFILSDYLTMVCIVFVLARSALTTVVLLWGNNNMTRPALNLTETEIYHRTVGSKLTLANRAVYNTYLWIQKSNVLLLCERVLSGLPEPEMIVKVYWIVLLGSLAAVMGTTFGECRPAHLYWQVLPDPGDCVKANIQLVTLVALNITTDAMLILLPMPWLLRVRKSWLKRLQYVLLFSVGLLLIAIAIVRLPVYSSSTNQVNRNTWGSVEEFFAAVAANVPTLFTLRKDPNKHKREEELSHSRPSARPRFTPNQFQDSDLFTTNVALDTVEQTGTEPKRGRSPGRARARSLPVGVTAAPSQENLVRDDSSHVGEGDYGDSHGEYGFDEERRGRGR